MNKHVKATGRGRSSSFIASKSNYISFNIQISIERKQLGTDSICPKFHYTHNLHFWRYKTKHIYTINDVNKKSGRKIERLFCPDRYMYYYIRCIVYCAA